MNERVIGSIVFGCILSFIIVVGVCTKGCNDSDNKVRAEAVNKGCLILQNDQFDCRGK